MSHSSSLERELVLRKLDEKSGERELVSRTTITFDEALERELEYQARIKSTLLQPLIIARPLAAPCEELSQRTKHVAIKRKADSHVLIQMEPKASRYLRNRESSVQELQALQQKTETRLLEQAFHQQPIKEQPLAQDLPPQMMYRKPSEQGSTYKQPSSQQSQDQFLNNAQQQPRLSHNQQLALKHVFHFWCNHCKVNCMNYYNYKQHCRGKQHTVRVARHAVLHQVNTNSGLNDVNLLWCYDCNVPCMNELSLAQHCAGKKHVARLKTIQAKIGGSGSSAAAAGAEGCT